MKDVADEVAAWASILGSTAAVVALLQSQAWMAVVAICCGLMSIGCMVYARRSRRFLNAACVHIDGLNLDSLNVANLRRRMNQSLFVQRAFHAARIEGETLSVSWRYEGFCRSRHAAALEFSIDTENNIPYNQLDCFAFDLRQDPECRHRIRPMLIGGDGLSKKVSVPFLKPLQFQQPFGLVLNCRLPGCNGSGVQYYTSSVSFAQRRIDRLAVQLVFVRKSPDWVRVYECDRLGRASLISELRPVKADEETAEYMDLAEHIAGQSVRIYVYQLSPSGLPQVEYTGRELKNQPGTNNVLLGLDSVK